MPKIICLTCKTIHSFKQYCMCWLTLVLLFLITFLKFWYFPKDMGKSRNPRWPPFNGSHDVLTTLLYDITSSCCMPHRKYLWTYMYYLYSKCHCHIFDRSRVMEGGETPLTSTSQPQKTTKSLVCIVDELNDI